MKPPSLLLAIAVRRPERFGFGEIERVQGLGLKAQNRVQGRVQGLGVMVLGSEETFPQLDSSGVSSRFEVVVDDVSNLA